MVINSLTRDHTDVAYREAVTRLRNILSPRTPTLNLPKTNTIPSKLKLNVKHTGNTNTGNIHTDKIKPSTSNQSKDYEDLFTFIDKQGDYVYQLESENASNRSELNEILQKVTEIIHENESLHAELKKSRFRPKANGVEGKIEELEAQLLQTKRSLRLAQEEVLQLRSIQNEQSHPNQPFFNNCDIHLAQITKITKEHSELEELVKQMKNRELEATKKVQDSIDLVETIKEEKSKMNLEMFRIKSDFESLQIRCRELTAESSKKLEETRSEIEKRFSNEINDTMRELESAKNEIQRQRLENNELKKDSLVKQRQIDDMQFNMQLKINSLEKELNTMRSYRSRFDSDFTKYRMEAEKYAKDTTAEKLRLEAELNLLRKRLDESEIQFGKAEAEIRRLSKNLNKKSNEIEQTISIDEYNLQVKALQIQHVEEVHELGKLLDAQRCLTEKFRVECIQIAQKLEESWIHFKNEQKGFESEKNKLLLNIKQNKKKCVDLESKLGFYMAGHEQMVQRLHSLEYQDKSHTKNIITLATKSNSALKENEHLKAEIELLKSRINQT